MSAFHIPPDRLEDLVTTLIANALAQYPSRPAVIARPSKNVGSSSLLDSQSPSVLKTLHEDFAVLHRSSSQANHKGTSSKASSHDEQIVQSQGLRSAVAESDVGYTGARRSTPPSSFAQEQTTPVDSKTPLTDTPFGVLPNDPSPTIGHVQGAAVVKAKGNGLKPVSGQCSTSSEPPSRRLSEIPDGHSSSSTDGPAPLDEQQHRRLAEAPPLSRTSDSTSSHSSKRLTAAAFFTPDSTPEYEGSSAGSTSFSDQDLTELLEEEKSKATATGKGTEEPNNHAESQDESAPETKTAAADISTGPHTDHKAKQNEKKLDRECRKAYEARMFSQSKPIFPGPVYSQVPVVRLPRPLTMPDVPSAPCQSIMSSSDTLQDAEQRQVSLLVGSKRHGQEPRPREPKRQRREPPSDRKIDPRDYRRLMKLQREYPSQRRMRGDSWRPRYDEWGWEL